MYLVQAAIKDVFALPNDGTVLSVLYRKNSYRGKITMRHESIGFDNSPLTISEYRKKVEERVMKYVKSDVPIQRR